jgi:hypothetical protein
MFSSLINGSLWASGGMVDALVLGTSRAICGGSSPFLPTTLSHVRDYLEFVMRFQAFSVGFLALCAMAVLLLSNNVANAHQYKFMCKNMFWVNQLMTVDAKSEDEARFKLKHDKKFKDYSHCTYQTMKTDEQLKRSGSQDSWGKRMLKKVDNAMQTAPVQSQQ